MNQADRDMDRITAAHAARDRALTAYQQAASVKETSTEGDSKLTESDMIIRDLASHDKATLEAVLGYPLSEASFLAFRANAGVVVEDPNPRITVTFTARIETSGIADMETWRKGIEDDEEKLVNELFSPFGSAYDIEVASLFVEEI